MVKLVDCITIGNFLEHLVEITALCWGVIVCAGMLSRATE